MDDEQEQYQKELSWCIAALRKNFQKADPSRNVIKESLKALQVSLTFYPRRCIFRLILRKTIIISIHLLQTLENPKAPMVKKRLAMRNALGDYRAKIAAEEKQLEKQLLQGKKKLAEFTPEKVEPANGRVLAKAAGSSTALKETQKFSFDFKV